MIGDIEGVGEIDFISHIVQMELFHY